MESYLKSVRQSQIINIWGFRPWRGNIIHQHADRQRHVNTIKLSCCHSCFCINVNYGLFLCAVWYFCWIFCSSLLLKFEISPFQTGQQNPGTRSYHFSPSTCSDFAGRMLDMFQLIFWKTCPSIFVTLQLIFQILPHFWLFDCLFLNEIPRSI